MKVIKTENAKAVKFHAGVSHRIITKPDNMGFGFHKTVISPDAGRVFQHYKNHLESCYCVSGRAILTNADSGEEFEILPDSTYVLDKYDRHYFEAIEETTLLCVFNPPLTGPEVHDEDGSYPLEDDGYLSPVYDVKRVPISQVTANDYNPNSVAPPEMALLETSIWEDGYTQPVVVVYDKENDKYVVIDGFHRYCVLRDSKRVNEREQAMLPVVVLKKEMHDRMASTIRHNRARGTHNIELMSTIVSELVEMGKGDAWICKHIGMSKDELLRLKQITGVAALFQNQDFSNSWDAENFEEVAQDGSLEI
jgi:ParB-like chromosome segregation protein Spo0J/mannose-6-phosphate isomerase-like protein (cupin superfamily)